MCTMMGVATLFALSSIDLLVVMLTYYGHGACAHRLHGTLVVFSRDYRSDANTGGRSMLVCLLKDQYDFSHGNALVYTQTNPTIFRVS